MENKIKIKQSNSLMRKTKSELVEIILRKDEIERNLREDIKETINQYKNTQNNFEHISYIHDTLKNNYEEICDEYTTYRAKIKNKIKNYNIFCYVLGGITVILIVLLYIMILML